MNLYQEILIQVLATENISVAFPNLTINAKDIVEMKCYQALWEIKEILENNELSDSQCFMKIESIIQVFEQMGGSGGIRHDFG